jgi:hypothetical protein
MYNTVAYGFDLDNTLFQTEVLKTDMARLCHERFSQVSVELFQDCYAAYRLSHQGRVHMGTILEAIAHRAGLSPCDSDDLTHEWIKGLPYDRYVFAGARELIADLGPQNVFFMTKSQDIGFQHRKLDVCRLPFIADNIHEWIMESKNLDVFSQWIAMMRDRGIHHLVYGSDEATEILWAHEAAQCAGLGFDGVHHQYGSLWKNNREQAQTVLGEQYHRAAHFRQFADIFRHLQGQLEGKRCTVEQGRSGSKEQFQGYTSLYER